MAKNRYDRVIDWIYPRMPWLIAIAVLMATVEVIVLWNIFAQPDEISPTAVVPSTSTLVRTPTPTLAWTPVVEPKGPTATSTPTTAPSSTPTQVVEPTSTVTPTPAIVDWRGEYFYNEAMIGLPALVRNDQAIDFDWGYNAPASELAADGFSARWTRIWQFEGGLYRFHAIMDDGMRLYVDGGLIIDEWRDGSLREVTADRRLSAGEHNLRVEYYERGGTALARLWWDKLTSYPDWKGEYWSNPGLQGNPVLVRNDAAVNFDWRAEGPGGVVPNDNFSARWTRKASFDRGTYRFHVLVDEGVRLWVDGGLIIDEWRDGNVREAIAEYTPVRGMRDIKVEYYERSGDARVHVWWEKIASPAYPDWKGEYWSNRDLSGDPVLARNDRMVNFDWRVGAPAYGLPTDDFSARWTRKASFDRGTYRFHALMDDGVRLWVDGDMIIDEWRDGNVREVIADYAPVRGAHEIKVEYYERSGDARVYVWWEKVVSPAYADWKGEYWPNRDLSGDPVLARNDRTINFDWRVGAPAYGLPADDFSARWTRRAGFDRGTYRFRLLVDDGARLWVDGDMIIDEWRDGSVREVIAEYAPVSGTYDIKVEYYEHSGDARVGVWWEKIASPAYPDWKGEYWPNRDLSADPALVRNDGAIDFSWGSGSPATGLPTDDFSARWSRQVTFQPGVYHLYAWADDGVRVYVDDTLVLNEWHGAKDEVYWAELALDGVHWLMVEYFEQAADARVWFWWKRTGDLPTPTPTATATATTTATNTVEPTPTATPTSTSAATATATVEPTTTATAGPTPTVTETATVE